MCTVCNAMFRKGMTDLCGSIRKNEGVFKDMKVNISLSLETNPVVLTRVWDLKNYDTLYEERLDINYCPFCGQNLNELDEEIED